MALGPQLSASLLADFRARLRESREENPEAWEASSRLVGQANLQATLKRLVAAIQASSFSPSLQEVLLAGLRGGVVERIQELPAEQLKQLTGLPATKAVRSLCVLFGLPEGAEAAASVATLTPTQVEQFVRDQRNPFDLLLTSEAASLLDLGAGDLSFAGEMVEQYMPRLSQQQKPLVLHCTDRVQPGSVLGTAYQADPIRLQYLRTAASSDLQFQYWGNQDMFELVRTKKVRPCYTIVTCQAPATPTFAYEPTRLSRALIEERLRQSKGLFRKVRVEGEEALEVLHEGRALIFPPWKFDIQGPLALLNLLARRSKLGILSAVDNEVFWELLAQLLHDERFRPADQLFNSENLAEIFGDVHAKLSALPVGGSIALAGLADLRESLPPGLSESGMKGRYRFRYVEVRRGAVFEGMPASRTARLFKDMKEEAPPWMLILVPDANIFLPPTGKG
ncbi:MAG: hypothetical protein HZA21_00600 [Nitrospirae bacterium]|nr:hypothetical protein [Nitrospirota bacterium]